MEGDGARRIHGGSSSPKASKWELPGAGDERFRLSRVLDGLDHACEKSLVGLEERADDATRTGRTGVMRQGHSPAALRASTNERTSRREER
ncbi:hypothetical protein AKJ08_2869 [Vulgatibacter incomptus]|uniref:Uncharacterized protein n=1 Tax=Vulgatibacter incomptus TaxID=1391653 RepID=A0A0K1PG49_9BACT|nr:hypothetical protein AKJ08_2869 [Vulgatibacter incomptus]